MPLDENGSDHGTIFIIMDDNRVIDDSMWFLYSLVHSPIA